VPPGTGWVTYVRCHDDIGWAVGDEAAAAVGEDGHLHRRFLADFYAGDFPGSFARGMRFQPDPATGEARTSGTTASLAGIEAALERHDTAETQLAVRRVLLLYAVAFAHGLPLIYMGDELGLRNDPQWAEDLRHRDDSRWLHRPAMDWEAAERRHDPGTIENALWSGMRRLVAARRSTRATHAQAATAPIDTGNEHVLGVLRSHGGERLLLLANVTEDDQRVPRSVATAHGMDWCASATDADGRPLREDGDAVVVAPYQHLWLLA
jgi:amylosucrase